MSPSRTHRAATLLLRVDVDIAHPIAAALSGGVELDRSSGGQSPSGDPPCHSSLRSSRFRLAIRSAREKLRAGSWELRAELKGLAMTRLVASPLT